MCGLIMLAQPAMAQIEPASAPGAQVSQPVRRVAPTRSRAASVVFANADIGAVADEVLGNLLHLRFAIDPAVTGKISFRASGSARSADLLASFEQALTLADIALVRNRDQYLLVPRSKAKALVVAQPLTSGDIQPGYQGFTIETPNSLPSEIAKGLTANGFGDVVVGADDKAGRIVIAGSASELRGAVNVIRASDRAKLDPGLSRTFALKNSSASQVSAELGQLLKGFDIAGVDVVPLTRLNQIVVGTRSPAQMIQVERWVTHLDVPASEESATVWRFKPRNLSAASLAEALTQLSAAPAGDPSSNSDALGDRRSDAAALPRQGEEPASDAVGTLLDDDLRIGVEKESNTLLVAASPSKWLRLRALFEELDASPAQVMIEATVLEVTLNRAFRMGVDWSIVGSGRWSAVSSRRANGAVGAVLPGGAITYLGGDVRAVIDALASKTHVEVVSAPKLLALDNHAATLQVGDQIPIVNQTSQSTSSPDAPIVSITEYRDTGVILKIKPRINDADSVTLDFSQEVSGVLKNTVSGIDSPTIQQRRFQSQVILREGETAALGGLMSTKRSRGGSGVPWLNELPGVGVLFGAKDDGTDRTEIIVLLTARIVRTPQQQAEALRMLKTQMPALDDHAAPTVH